MSMVTNSRQQQIAEFLNSYVTELPRCYSPWRQSLSSTFMWPNYRPSAEQVAQELLGVAAFRALQLGTWLRTTDGQILVEAVEMVLPMFYAEDVQLLVDALTIAAATQQAEGKQKAKQAALASVIGLAVSIGLASGRGRAA
jgi:hypothetical protein